MEFFLAADRLLAPARFTELFLFLDATLDLLPFHHHSFAAPLIFSARHERGHLAREPRRLFQVHEVAAALELHEPRMR